MAPTPPQAVDNGRSSGDQPRDVRDVEDEEEYERDGWRIGFDVAFHGVGRTAENGDEESEEEFATGFGTPPIAAAEDSTSEFESDPESDVETEPRNPTEGAPDGYVALRTIIEDPRDRPEVSEDDEEEKEAETKPENVPNLHFSHSFVSPGISKDFQQALEDANSVYSNHSCLELATVPSSSGQPINMDKHKITEIRKIMANVSIPEPYWAKDLGDTKVLELLEKLKRKEKD
ncbi:hypothetical protein L596_011886 [Steinernema carpocapsae]|uniref:Male-enhanced antigen 1 n=1 Tax=Steinernema carpocapsae TaxID=34508 RepID=A0A4U5NVC8_STECR|nr:hypothetical protein L596_011886 [Steinernema carpocapsae]